MTLTDKRPTADKDAVETKPSGMRMTHPWWPIAVLIAIPLVIFLTVYLLGGGLLLNGDNLIQNYPLRVLVGSQLRHGVLPWWDPWMWSGTPLMAGMNAGAFYPTTLIFAIMSGPAAWITAEVFVFSLASVGTYFLLRECGISVVPSFIGASFFAFAGAFEAQTAVHIDMGNGLASLPWILLAVQRIISDGRWRWAFLASGAFALTILASAPEAMIDVTMATLIYGGFRLSLKPGAWFRVALRGLFAAAVAAGITSFAWLPGFHFIGYSQRGHVGASFIGAYSFPARATFLAVTPYIEAGYGVFSQPQYLGQSNLPEVASYVGLFAIIAIISLGSRRWSSWLPRGERRVWFGLLICGFVLALGSATPFEHVLLHIPLIGQQRDQGRHIAEVDLAACALLAWFIDGGERPAHQRVRSDFIGAVIPITVTSFLGIWLIISPSSLWRFFKDASPGNQALSGIGASVAIALALSIGALVLVVARAKLSYKLWLKLIVAFCIADIAIYSAGSSFITDSSQLPPNSGPNSQFQEIKSYLSPGGRYAVIDPDLFYPNSLIKVGVAGIGVLAHIPSVTGYGAIADGTYSSMTGTEGHALLDPLALRNGVFGQVGLQEILIPSQCFLIPIASPPTASGEFKVLLQPAGTDPVLPGGNIPVAQDDLPLVGSSGPAESITVGQNRGWYYGTTLRVSNGVVMLNTKAHGQVIQAGAIEASGGTTWGPPVYIKNGATTIKVTIPSTNSVGVSVRLLSGPTLGPSRIAVGAGGREFLVDGLYALSITPGGWAYKGVLDNFAHFQSTYVPSYAWIEQKDQNHPVVGNAQLVSNSSPNSALFSVTTNHPALLIRSEAYDPGWHAQIEVSSGLWRDASVIAVGLDQGVDVPAGHHLVRFTYVPVGIYTGLKISITTLIGTLLCWAAWLLTRRYRHRAQVDT
ncbi:MAG: hypothetical protein HKL80_02335 [Acidimicrobiales bacterium]|nr:hypothetical protein [Acidimicrobiales bacterium]